MFAIPKINLGGYRGNGRLGTGFNIPPIFGLINITERLR